MAGPRVGVLATGKAQGVGLPPTLQVSGPRCMGTRGRGDVRSRWEALSPASDPVRDMATPFGCTGRRNGPRCSPHPPPSPLPAWSAGPLW